MKFLTPRRVAVAVLLMFPIVVALQNLDQVYVEFLVWHWNIPLIYIILGGAIFGFAAGWLGHIIWAAVRSEAS